MTRLIVSMAVDGKRFLELNASSIFQEPILGLVKVPRIEESFDSRNLYRQLPLIGLIHKTSQHSLWQTQKDSFQIIGFFEI